MRNPLVIPCNNHPIQQQLGKVGLAINQLNKMGFTVNSIELDGHQRPSIRVAFDGYCRKEQEKGKAVRYGYGYGYGYDQQECYKLWQMQIGRCRVSWEVR